MTDGLPDLAVDPRALRVCKKPIPVQVEFAVAEGTCGTLEGPVRFRAGDAIVTGVRGERWPVSRDAFLSAYQAVPPTQTGRDGVYRKGAASAHAMRLEERQDVPVGWQNDPLHGEPGDWLLQYADGSRGVLRDQIFRESYEPASGETRWPPPA
jgi:PGDYG protein